MKIQTEKDSSGRLNKEDWDYIRELRDIRARATNQKSKVKENKDYLMATRKHEENKKKRKKQDPSYKPAQTSYAIAFAVGYLKSVDIMKGMKQEEEKEKKKKKV